MSVQSLEAGSGSFESETAPNRIIITIDMKTVTGLLIENLVKFIDAPPYSVTTLTESPSSR